MQLGPYINFQGRAREAMEFYHRLLGGNLDLQPASGDRIGFARLEADGLLLLGSDGHPQYPPTVGDNMAVALRGTDRERLTRIFDGLAEGGTVKGPLAKQPGGGGEVGWLMDRFGTNWTIGIDER
jgi:PhnB protein